MTDRDVRPTLAAPDDDPYLWLEEVEGEGPVAWVEQQNNATLTRFADARFERDRDTLAALLDRPDNIPLVSRRGRYLYNLWRDAQHTRGLWRRTTMASYRQAEPEWQTLLDLDALALSEGEDWVWSGAHLEPAPRERAILCFSRGGSDAVVYREFDLTTLRFIADGFNLPQAKGGVVWLDRDTVLMIVALGEDSATTSGYARLIRLWRRGSDPLQAPVIFEAGAEAMSVWADVDRTAGAERIWFVERPAFFEMLGWLGDRSGPKQRLDLPADAEWTCFGDWIAIKPRKAWTVGTTTHPPDTLLGLSIAAFMSGSREFSVLFEPAPRRALSSFFWNAGQLVIAILDNLQPRFEVATPQEGTWAIQSITALPNGGVVHAWSLDDDEADSNGELLVSTQDPLTPPQVLLFDLNASQGQNAPVLLKHSPKAFNAKRLAVSHHQAVSIDGELIPYTQIGPTMHTGDAFVHITGYGGFGVSVEPTYGASIGKLWLEEGGTSVIANIRGGGEFGSPWHDAGRREGKQLCHDDFAAIAADLVRRGVTRPERIAAQGGSNGGLLIANMLTRYPERFGALFCTIPLIDMRRYNKLLAGASWMDEYGDPDKPEDWDFLQHISAYHVATLGKPYPPILIATTRRDDRVHPGHARKMAAKLQAMGYEAHFYEPEAGGHGYGKDNTERAAFIALGYSFMRKAIGWE